MIEHPTWRSLIYKLAEDYPDCLMLTFTIKVGARVTKEYVLKVFVGLAYFGCGTPRRDYEYIDSIATTGSFCSGDENISE